VACTYYIQAPDAGGEFYYVDTGRVGQHSAEIKTITPATGDLIFFPAYMLHGVETNRGKTRVNLTTSFTHELTENSRDRYQLKSYIDSMKRIKDL
jgi:ectoine hydroxylase-related dioxygenase (phytanoyl-CoA dioxygenase family)